jgi:hypothetical protein
MNSPPIGIIQKAATGFLRSPSTATRRVGLVSLTDLALVCCGMAAAGASIAFAGYMLVQPHRKPRINGMEYLAIFAQPKESSRPDTGPTARPIAPRRRIAAQKVDPTPTGSILKNVRSPRVTDESFHIIGGRTGLVWLRKEETILAVRVGDVVAGLGRIGAITRRDGRWVLLDENGALLSTTDDSAPAGQDPGERFSRSLIFDNARR